MTAVVTDRFRQLVAGVTDAKGFEALMLHIRSSNSEGFCPVCASALVSNQATDLECMHGPSCIHGECVGCNHSSHYDPSLEPDIATLPIGEILSTRAVLQEVIAVIDSGGSVSMRPFRETDRHP
jgi:hypothetical protein